MLHVIIWILKIAGILVLILLGLLILLIGSVLFVPVTYRFYAERKDGVLKVRAVAGWMLRFLSLHYRLDTSAEPKQLLQGRILGIPIWKPLEPEKEKKPKRSETKKKTQEQPEQPEKPAETAKERLKKDLAENKEPAEQTEEAWEAEMSEEPTETLPEPAAMSEVSQPGTEKPKRQSIFKKLLYAIRRIYDKITTIGKKILQMPGKIGETIETLTTFWNLEEHVKAREHILAELKFIWKHGRPRKANLTLKFGFDDPSWTGQCMGFLSVLKVWYPGSISLNPEFEQEIFEGTLYIKGHMILAVPLLSAFRLWRDENVKKMYRHWKH